jgi:hypothetical protein
MDWNEEAETIISQLLNGNDEPFNQAVDAVWFKRTLDDDSRLALARALANKFNLIKDLRVKGSVLRLIGWADSALAYEIALNELENTASEAVCHAQYLYDSVLVIARERYDLFKTYSLSSRKISKNLRLSYALLHDKPIVDGDCLEADEVNSLDYNNFLTALSERRSQ